MRRPVRLVFTALPLLALTPIITRPVAGQAAPQIVTQVQHSGRDLTIYANGIPVAQASGDMNSHMFQVGSFLTNGRNVIRFEWVRRKAGGMAFSAVVQENRKPGGLTDLATVDAIDDDPVGEPSTREVTVEVSQPRPWAWEGGADVIVDSAVRSGVIEAVRELHGAYAVGDAGKAITLTETMWTELSGFREGFVDRVRGRYESMMAEPGWSVEPLNEEAIRVEAFGPLVRVLSDGPLIRSGELASGGRLSIVGLFYVLINGRWMVVRPVS